MTHGPGADRQDGGVRVRSDRVYRFPHPPAAVWESMGRVDAYRSWWPWLRRFHGQGLVVGDRWRCTIVPPIPYSLALTITIVDARPSQLAVAEVSGDITGEATVELDHDGTGSRVRLRSSLAPARQPLRTVAALAPWMARRGHDWVLDTGARQFGERALG